MTFTASEGDQNINHSGRPFSVFGLNRRKRKWQLCALRKAATIRSALETTQQTPSLSQAQRIKQESKEGKLTEESVLSIMAEEKKPLYNSVIKYNCDILMRDVPPEEKYHTRSEREDR